MRQKELRKENMIVLIWPIFIPVNMLADNPNSPLLFGEIGEGDVIKERAVKSSKENQLTIFDL